MRGHSLMALGALAVAGGCSDELTELDGIYEIDVWTLESGGCAGPGTSVTEQREEPYFGISEAEFFGREYIQGGPCSDLESCREQADGTLLFFGWNFERGNDSDGWTGAIISAYPVDDACGGSLVEQRLSDLGGDRVRVESITTQVMGVAPQSDGECSTDDVEVAASTMPCTARELIEGAFVEPI